MVEEAQSRNRPNFKAAATQHPRRFLVPATVLLCAAIATWLFIPRSVQPIRPVTSVTSVFGPTIEGKSVNQVFGLHRGLYRYEVRKLAKPYSGKAVRISGTVRQVQSPASDIKNASLQGPGQADSGVSLMFRQHFEPDFGRLKPGLAIRVTCMFRGHVEPDHIRFEDCRFAP